MQSCSRRLRSSSIWRSTILGQRQLIPTDPAQAAVVRRIDRVFDNYVMNVMQAVVARFCSPRPDYGGLSQQRAAS